jgi:SWI/SNF-related matrix-associated actin-dependent regulator of chromatin subfamily A member 5
MYEDILSYVVPSNTVSRQASQKRSNQLGENSHSFQPSQGANGESEFDDEPLEEDELISADDVSVRAVAVVLASTDIINSFSSSKKIILATTERKEKTKKRTAVECQLQIKRQKWTKQRRVLSRQFVSQNLIPHKVADAVKRYAYLLGQTELFKLCWADRDAKEVVSFNT